MSDCRIPRKLGSSMCVMLILFRRKRTMAGVIVAVLLMSRGGVVLGGWVGSALMKVEGGWRKRERKSWSVRMLDAKKKK